ncbi:hypothetical protein KY337_01725 [Candidatus Woesearchaeota archaeon]|nr:hypothetical protein [Candidatus Woesearchaeota archaeon]
MANQFQGMPLPENVYRRRRLMFFIGIIIVILIVVALVIYFRQPAEEVVVEGFRVNKVDFAGSIDDNFVYTPKSDFVKGESLWVYAELADYPEYKQPEGYLISATMGMITYGPDGQVYEPLTGKVTEVNDFAETAEVLRFAAEYSTADLEPGDYYIDFVFVEDISSTILTATGEFSLR